MGAQGAKLVLLSWLIVSGAGATSLDNLLGRGLSRIPFRLSQEDDSAPEDLPHVVVIGGGVAAAQGLRDARCRVTSIEQRFRSTLRSWATASFALMCGTVVAVFHGGQRRRDNGLM